jgi:hypothetical protein
MVLACITFIVIPDYFLVRLRAVISFPGLVLPWLISPAFVFRLRQLTTRTWAPSGYVNRSTATCCDGITVPGRI